MISRSWNLTMKSIKNIILIIFGVFLLSYIILPRFLRVSHSKPLFTEVTPYFIITALCLAILFLLLTIKNVRGVLLEFKIITHNSYPWLINIKAKFLFFFNLLYYEPLKLLDKQCKSLVSLKVKKDLDIIYLHKLTNLLYANIAKHNSFIDHSNRSSILLNKYFHIYLISKTIPKIIVLISFEVDIFYHQKLYYFYFTALLLLIPLFFQYITYVLQEHFSKPLERFNYEYEVLEDAYINPTNSSNIVLSILSITEIYERSIFFHLTNTPNPYNNKIGVTLQAMRDFRTKYNTSLDTEKVAKRSRPYIIYWGQMHVILWIFKQLDTYFDKYANLIIFTGYFIGWIYITFNLLYDFNFEGLSEVIIFPIDNPFN